MKRIPIRAKIQIQLDTPMHVGGGKGNNGICSYLLRNENSVPYWPGSAFKGKVRHFARMLWEGSGEQCVFEHALSMDEDTSQCGCLVCDMMGSAGNRQGSLIFSDMVFADECDIHSDTRTGNAIDRYRRVAKDKSLFQTEFAESDKNVLIGEITGTLPGTCIDKEKALLDAAIRSIPYIGGNTSRGLGWIKENGITVDIEEITVEEGADPAKTNFVTLPVSIKLMSPLLIGSKTANSNFRTTQYHIPGSLIRAALAHAIVVKDGGENSGKNNWIEPKDEKCLFPTLRTAFGKIHITQFLPKDCRFAPITAEKCKYKSDDKTGRTYDRLQYELGNEKEEGWGPENCRKERVKTGFIHRLNGTLMEYPLSMVVSKSAMNRYRGTSQDEMLYSMEIIAPITTEPFMIFEGSISGEFDPDELKNLVKNGIRIGGYQTAGYGRCEVTIGDPVLSEDEKKVLAERIARFGQKVPVTLLSDAFVEIDEPSDISNESYLQAYQDALFLELPSEVKLSRVIAQHFQWRGFDTSKKKGYLKNASHVIKAGAVFVLETEKWTDVMIDALMLLHKSGICKGLDALNGYGQVSVADPYHMNEMIEMETKQSDMEEIDMELQQSIKKQKDAIDELKPELIEIVDKLFKDAEKKVIPSKRQYSDLLQAASKSACVEEITLLIRYKKVKEGSKKEWKHLADPLANAIDVLKVKAENISKRIDDPTENKAVDYHLQLTRLLLGYLMWNGCVEYAKREENKDVPKVQK